MLPLAALAFALIAMPSAVWSYPISAWVALGAVVGLILLRGMFANQRNRGSDLYTLISDGTLHAHRIAGEEVGYRAYTLHPASKITPWGIALAVTQTGENSAHPSAKYLRWVLKGECAEADYRRLCRAVLQAHHPTATRNNIDVS